MRRRLLITPAVAALCLALAACGAGPEDPAGAGTADEAGEDHGEIAGAAELAEPALGLTSVDAAGTVRHLDLLDEEVAEIAEIGEPTAVHTDGRYLYVGVEDGLHLVDSGVWTWDHVDHFHYYRAESRDLGLVEGTGPATVATTTSSTSGAAGVAFGEAGEGVLLDVEAMSKGSLEELARVDFEPHDAMLVPVGDHALLTRPGPSGAVEELVAIDAEGEPLGSAAIPCPDAAGTITTRVGTVVGCADGALLAVPGDEGPEVERVPYPAGTDVAPASTFANRDGRPTVAGLADADHVWLLDTRARAWELLESPVPLVQVTAVDDDEEHVVGLTEDGRVAVLDGESGELLATTDPLAARSVGGEADDAPGEPVLVADQQRVYLTAPAEVQAYEIDFADGARVSRTFRAEGEPLFAAGTGR